MAVLPESYQDERNITHPAFKWPRENNPFGVAQLDAFDPIVLVTCFDDLVTIERQPANEPAIMKLTQEFFGTNDLAEQRPEIQMTSDAVSPVKHFIRCAHRDVEVVGRQFHERGRLMLNYLTANRDETRFGHQCQGMMIARLELKLLFEELLPRLGSIELTGTPKYTEANFVGGLKSLPVRLRPA